MKVSGKDGGDLTYQVPLHLSGPQQVIAASGAGTPEDLDVLAPRFKSMAASKDRTLPLRTTVHPFPEPLRAVLGPVAGHLVLVGEKGHADFFSIEARKIDGSFQGLPGGVGVPAGVYQIGGGRCLNTTPRSARSPASASRPDNASGR